MSQEEVEQRLWQNLSKWSLQKNTLNLPQQKFNTIVLDPPWRISLSGKNIRRKQQATKFRLSNYEL